jgi:hypothetical protein
MKLGDAAKFIDAGWVKKPKGFRVHFQKRMDGEVITDYTPGPKEKPMDSDVAAWRLAWKLDQAQTYGGKPVGDGELFNIYVVDDANNPVNYYATGQPLVFNAYEEGARAQKSEN